MYSPKGSEPGTGRSRDWNRKRNTRLPYLAAFQGEKSRLAGDETAFIFLRRQYNQFAMARPPAPTFPHWLLRRGEQAIVACWWRPALSPCWAIGSIAAARRAEWWRSNGPSRNPHAFRWTSIASAWAEFATLPGVGRKLAERIVQSREQQGPFADLDDLRRVRGVGPHTLETMRPYLRPMPSRQAVAGK